MGLWLLERKVTLLPFPNAFRNLPQRAVVVLLSVEQDLLSVIDKVSTSRFLLQPCLITWDLKATACTENSTGLGEGENSLVGLKWHMLCGDQLWGRRILQWSEGLWYAVSCIEATQGSRGSHQVSAALVRVMRLGWSQEHPHFVIQRQPLGSKSDPCHDGMAHQSGMVLQFAQQCMQAGRAGGRPISNVYSGSTTRWLFGETKMVSTCCTCWAVIKTQMEEPQPPSRQTS